MIVRATWERECSKGMLHKNAIRDLYSFGVILGGLQISFSITVIAMITIMVTKVNEASAGRLRTQKPALLS